MFVFHLIEYDPARVDLRVAHGVERDGLEGPEVGRGQVAVVRTHIQPVVHAVRVKIVLAPVTHAVIWTVNRHHY